MNNMDRIFKSHDLIFCYHVCLSFISQKMKLPIKSSRYKEIPFSAVEIQDIFWSPRLAVNRDSAIFHQWKELEKNGFIDNFRITAGIKKGFRKGFFYNDSDVHKWVDAAARILASRVSNADTHSDSDNNDNDSENDNEKKRETESKKKLTLILNEYIEIMRKAQTEDGYLFTYNQLHFPEVRWVNIQIEHELYTIGHLIEAGIAHFQASKERSLLEIACKSADLVAEVFQDCPSSMTPGHQEVELALIKLYRVTGHIKYLNTAINFLEMRGGINFFAIHLIRQFMSHVKRSKIISKQQISASSSSEEGLGFDFSENLMQKEPPLLGLRSRLAFLSGKYHQQHTAIRKMLKPVGHSVRWAYLATAVTMLYQETGDSTLIKTLSTAWDHMIKKRMYATGGIGSLPVIEGFGLDYELNSEFAYCETCAALGSIFWSREMLLCTGEAKYADLIEWQLYNAASVGIALDGCSYLYRNPLESSGGLVRKEWFETACCPGNVSRTWASLGKDIYMHNARDCFVNQYIGSKINLFSDEVDIPSLSISMQSNFPWEGKAVIELESDEYPDCVFHLRIPSWAKDVYIKVNGKKLDFTMPNLERIQTGAGYSPYQSYFVPIEFKKGNDYTQRSKNVIEIEFPFQINILKAHKKVKTNRGKIALSRGPIIYCLESTDNPGESIPGVQIDLTKPIKTVKSESKLGGIIILEARDVQNRPIQFIPYYCWANRGESRMQVWVESSGSTRADNP